VFLELKKKVLIQKNFYHLRALENATLFQGGFNLTISKSDNFNNQIEEVEKIIVNNREALENLVLILSTDAPELNFGYDRNSAPVQVRIISALAYSQM